MKSILLVAPFLPSTDPLSLSIPLSLLKVKAPLVPLHLATVAALTPDDVQVGLWDEQVRGRIEETTELGKEYDLVGITGYSSNRRRAQEVARIFRQRGVTVAMGGVGVSTTPERYLDVADVLFLGEAELTWPQFITDWKSGNHRRRYRQVTKPDLAASPAPRWDAIADQMHFYLGGAVQTSRGCPFDCEFCNVVSLFGHQFRNKPVDSVLAEVNTLVQLGMEQVFFSDDNFVGNPRYVKDLLRELIPLNNSFRKPAVFSTQLSINVAKDEKLLEMLADANFGSLFIGIETPNKGSLAETGKLQNYSTDLVADVRKIQSYGLTVRAGMIVGFDHDDGGIFDQQFQFIQKAGISLASVSMLKAIPGTRLWERMAREGRLVEVDTEKNTTGHLTSTNIVPEGMTVSQLFNGYYGLMSKLGEWSSFEERIKTILSGIRRRPELPKRKRQWKRIAQVARLLLSQDKESRRSIFRVIMHTRRRASFMMDRVIGLAVQHLGFVSRLPFLSEDVQKQIRLAESGTSLPRATYTQPFVPEVFEVIYRNTFPEIHQQVYQGLMDKGRTDETLLGVFVDFIHSLSNTPGVLADASKEILRRLADNRVAAENGATFTLPVGVQTAQDVVRTGLVEEILKAIQQELRIKAYLDEPRGDYVYVD